MSSAKNACVGGYTNFTSSDYSVKPSGSLVSFLQGKLGFSLVSFD